MRGRTDSPAMAQRRRVAAAFAGERDAAYAIRLTATAIGEPVDYALRRVVSERGEVDMVVLEATCSCAAVGERVLTVMQGAHGVPIPIDTLDGARAG
jgi:hypothetical protein